MSIWPSFVLPIFISENDKSQLYVQVVSKDGLVDRFTAIEANDSELFSIDSGKIWSINDPALIAFSLSEAHHVYDSRAPLILKLRDFLSSPTLSGKPFIRSELALFCEEFALRDAADIESIESISGDEQAREHYRLNVLCRDQIRQRLPDELKTIRFKLHKEKQSLGLELREPVTASGLEIISVALENSRTVCGEIYKDDRLSLACRSPEPSRATINDTPWQLTGNTFDIPDRLLNSLQKLSGQLSNFLLDLESKHHSSKRFDSAIKIFGERLSPQLFVSWDYVREFLANLAEFFYRLRAFNIRDFKFFPSDVSELETASVAFAVDVSKDAGRDWFQVARVEHAVAMHMVNDRSDRPPQAAIYFMSLSLRHFEHCLSRRREQSRLQSRQEELHIELAYMMQELMRLELRQNDTHNASLLAHHATDQLALVSRGRSQRPLDRAAVKKALTTHFYISDNLEAALVLAKDCVAINRRDVDHHGGKRDLASALELLATILARVRYDDDGAGALDEALGLHLSIRADMNVPEQDSGFSAALKARRSVLGVRLKNSAVDAEGAEIMKTALDTYIALKTFGESQDQKLLQFINGRPHRLAREAARDYLKHEPISPGRDLDDYKGSSNLVCMNLIIAQYSGNFRLARPTSVVFS